jgi:nicotinamidase-related amidase
MIDLFVDSAVARSGRRQRGIAVDTQAYTIGSWGAEFAPQVAPDPSLGDIEVIKKGNGGFDFTHLHRLLRNLGVDQCLVTGGAIGGCVEDTILGGVALGYSMVAIEDACYRPDAGERLRMLEPKAFVITIDELMGASSAKLAAATA